MSSIEERLRKLTRQQRAQLADKLPPPEDGILNTRLLAFIVPASGHPVQDSDTIRRMLTGLLPEFMIPSFIIILDALPMTPNGKLDRKAMESMEPEIKKSPRMASASLKDTEKALIRIWSDVLALELVEVQDNFFELGGDSILSIHIVARARQAGIEITPAMIFTHPTIAQLASVIDVQHPPADPAEREELEI